MKSFKEIFTNTGPKPLFKKKTQMQKRILGKNYKYIVKENYKNNDSNNRNTSIMGIITFLLFLYNTP